jgi:hypothetical protein
MLRYIDCTVIISIFYLVNLTSENDNIGNKDNKTNLNLVFKQNQIALQHVRSIARCFTSDILERLMIEHSLIIDLPYVSLGLILFLSPDGDQKTDFCGILVSFILRTWPKYDQSLFLIMFEMYSCLLYFRT